MEQFPQLVAADIPFRRERRADDGDNNSVLISDGHGDRGLRIDFNQYTLG
jgi:hypothetical protein